MTYLKAGTWLALAFASGGVAGVYWFSPPHSEKSEPRPADDHAEVAAGTTESAKQRELRSQEVQPASEPSLRGSSSRDGVADEERAETEQIGHSAAEILWALEQAYQDQERRIRLLEATLREEMQAEAPSEGEELSLASAETNGLAHVDRDVADAETNWVPQETVALLPEPQEAVASRSEPVEVNVFVDHRAAPVTQQQVVLLNHYQPVFVNDPTPPLATSPRNGFVGSATVGGLPQRRGQARQDFKQDSRATTSWVASGFDVYTR